MQCIVLKLFKRLFHEFTVTAGGRIISFYNANSCLLLFSLGVSFLLHASLFRTPESTRIPFMAAVSFHVGESSYRRWCVACCFECQGFAAPSHLRTPQTAPSFSHTAGRIRPIIGQNYSPLSGVRPDFRGSHAGLFILVAKIPLSTSQNLLFFSIYRFKVVTAFPTGFSRLRRK